MVEAIANRGKLVVIAGLDATFQREAFGSLLNLIPKAESVKKLNAVCLGCGVLASFTERVIGQDKGVKLVGSLDMYRPVCRECYNGSRKVPLKPVCHDLSLKRIGMERRNLEEIQAMVDGQKRQRLE